MSAFDRYLSALAASARVKPLPARAKHVVNISGGKDSTATYLLAIRRGIPFRAVFADTGHEHPTTYDFVRRLAAATGGPEVEIVKADFSRQMANKRRTVETKWREDGVPEARAIREENPVHNIRCVGGFADHIPFFLRWFFPEGYAGRVPARFRLDREAGFPPPLVEIEETNRES